MKMKYPDSVFLENKWHVPEVLLSLNFSPSSVICKSMFGNLRFILYLNKSRMKSKRKTGDFVCLRYENNKMSFNFNQIQLCQFLWRSDSDAVIVNTSPAFAYHYLFLPDKNLLHPQCITTSSLEKVLIMHRSLSSSNFVSGFNSPFAGATVNHLHFHTLHIPVKPLPISNFVFEMLCNKANIGFCDFYYRRQYKLVIDTKEVPISGYADLLWKWSQKCTQLGIAYNLAISSSTENVLTVFFLPRKPTDRMSDWMATGFLELSGYILVSTDELYETVSQHEVLNYVKETAELSVESCNELESYMLETINEL